MKSADSLRRGVKLVGKTLGESIDFGKDNFGKVFKYLVVGVLAIVVAIAAAILLGLGVGVLLGDAVGGPGSSAFVMGMGILFAFAGLTYGTASLLGGMEFVHTGKKIPYFTSKNIWVALKWLIFCGIVTVLFYGGLFAMMLVLGNAYSAILNAVLNLVMIVTGIVLGVLLYYIYPELAVNKRGPIDAIVTSYKIAKNNLWETTMMFLLVYAVTGIIFGIIYLLGIGVAFMVLLAGLAVQLDATAWIAVGILIFIALIVMLGIYLIISAASYIINMKFYRNVMAKGEK